jgi:aspartyl-tRNA(Asn)/glutamyl-tRNA(Gln) amidotransferase subunit C
MKISKDEIEHIAELARLSLSDREKEVFGVQLSSILGYMEKLNELDTSSIQPTSHVLSLSNVMRNDVTKDSLPRDEVLKNAPACTDKFYRVPKIID